MSLILVAVSLIWIIVILGILYLALQQYNSFGLIRQVGILSKLPTITVIVPARNEEKNIERCVRSLMSQDYPKNKFRLVIVDDGSTDKTASIVSRLIKLDKRVKLLKAGDLPKAWTGKSHACWRGVKYASGEWICFIDADTKAQPDLISKTVSYAISKKLDLLSLNPFQELKSFWEKVIVPPEFFLYGLTMDLGSSPDSNKAVASGQFMMMKRSSYDSIGGHLAVRTKTLEDLAFARIFKKEGLRVGFVRGDHLMSVRMYDGLVSVWQGLARLKVTVFGSMLRAVAGTAIAFLMVWGALILPVWAFVNFVETGALITMQNLFFALIIFGSILVISSQIGSTKFFKIPWGYALLFPLGYAIGVLITLKSILHQIMGYKIWKGRVCLIDNE